MFDIHQYIEYLADFKVIICRKCQHGIWPDQINGHFKGKQHKMSQKQASQIGELITDEFEELWVSRETIQTPSTVSVRVPQLPVHVGYMCVFDPDNCQHIQATEKHIKEHCRQSHNWTKFKQAGRPTAIEIIQAAKNNPDPWKVIKCQRLFIQGPHSSYFKVQEDRGQSQSGRRENRIEIDARRPANSQAIWAGIKDEVMKNYAEIEKEMKAKIDEGEMDEVNRWLERTGWNTYLVGLDRLELMESVNRPDPNDEPVSATIWTAIGRLIRFSQQTIAKKAGIFVRMEAIRTEAKQTRYIPLMAYQDYEAMTAYIKPWQQVMMFFARTQVEHEWESPKYRLTKRQKRAWKAVCIAAEMEVGKSRADREREVEEGNGRQEPNHQRPRQRRKRRGADEEGQIDEAEEQREETAVQEQEDLTALQHACLEFCIALLDQTSMSRDYECAMICAIAVLGVDGEGWKGTDRYPPILSRLIKIARFFVVEKAWQDIQPEEKENPERGDGEDSDGDESSQESEAEAEAEAEVEAEVEKKWGVIQAVAHMMDRFMVRGTHRPMEWMLDLRTYGLKIHYNTTVGGKVDWRNGDTIQYKALQFSMDAFRGFVHKVVVETRQQLEGELLQGFDPPMIPWESLCDDASNEADGWSFLHDQRNQLPVNGETWLFDKIAESEAVRNRFVQPRTGNINKAEIDRFMSSVTQFRARLLVLMHITGGQPARAPEILSIRHSNTIKGQHRNLFIEDGLVVFVTKYHKGYVMSGDVKIIHRYLPKEVGDILVKYLWLVLPFQARMEKQYWQEAEGNSRTISHHLWPKDPGGKKWTSARVRNAIKQESAEGLGQVLTIQSYREIAIGISRKFMRDVFSFEPDEDDEDGDWNEDNVGKKLASIADRQAGHTSHVAGTIYARLLHEMNGSTAEMRKQFRESSIMWHAFLKFESTMEGEQDYETKAAGGKKRQTVRPGFGGTWKDDMERARIARWKFTKSVDVDGELKKMMGPDAEFRGTQQPAIEAIMRGDAKVVAIMATGEGKSVLFMLPAICVPGGLTVVVVPLIALRQDMIERCRGYRIKCAEWKAGRPMDDVSMVLVTPESAVSENFQTYLNRVKIKLDRIVIDECHVVLNDSTSFRRRMSQLGKLVNAEVQTILLTATLPPSKEEELWKRMHWKEGRVSMFRARTTRKNIRYKVMELGDDSTQKEWDDTVIKVAEAKHKQYYPGKVIVYANTVQKVKDLADELGVDAYYSAADMKAEKFEDFRSGREQVIVATSALGLGVDIPDIRAVIHVDQPRDLEDYVQESGRAGRDRQKSEAIVVICPSRSQVQQKGSPSWDEKEKGELVERFIQQRGRVEEGGCRICRRVVLDSHMDGVERVECQDDEEACDVCRPSEVREEGEERGIDIRQHNREVTADVIVEMVPVRGSQGVSEVRVSEADVRSFRQEQGVRSQPREEAIEQTKEEAEDWRKLEERIRFWHGKCAICVIARREDGNSHDLYQCRAEGSREAQAVYQKIRQGIVYMPGAACNNCGVPMAMCNRYSEGRDGNHRLVPGVQCTYRGTIISGWVGMMWAFQRQTFPRWEDQLIMAKIDKELIWDFTRGGRVSVYLGGRIEMNGQGVSRMAIEFSKMASRVERRMEKKK